LAYGLNTRQPTRAWDLGLNCLLAGIGEVSKRGFAYAGTGADADAAAAAGFMDTPAGKVALVAMASGAPQLAKPDTWAAPGRPGVNYLDLRAGQKARILGAVREAARKAKFVIVYQHNHFWGEATGVAAPPDGTLDPDELRGARLAGSGRHCSSRT